MAPAAPSSYVVPQRSSGSSDVSTWALVALVVALVAGGAAYLVGTSQGPGSQDVEMAQAAAYQDGRLAGREKGYRKGVREGRRIGRLDTRSRVMRQRTSAYRRGLAAGRDAGRSQRDGWSTFGGPTNPYETDVDSLSSGPLSYDTELDPIDTGSAYAAETAVPLSQLDY